MFNSRASAINLVLVSALLVCASASASPLTVRDEFSTASWGNDDGTASWEGGWIENDVSGSGPSDGRVRVVSGELRLDDRPRTGSLPRAARKVDLSGVSSAVLSFDFRTGPGVEAFEDVAAVEISADGGSSYTVLELFDDIEGALSGSRQYDVSDHLSADTTVRFRIHDRYGGPNEYFYVDNLEIAFSTVQYSEFPALTGADQLHAQGITGDGVTVALIDTGMTSWHSLDENTQGVGRVLARYDAIADQAGAADDDHGHGTHVASIIADSQRPRSRPGAHNGSRRTPTWWWSRLSAPAARGPTATSSGPSTGSLPIRASTASGSSTSPSAPRPAPTTGTTPSTRR